MYNLNTAVTKSILAKLPKNEFLKEFDLIRERYLKSSVNTNEHFKYANLYNWCMNHYKMNIYGKPEVKPRKYRNTA